ncbi:ComEA family DNA-binding protein [Streptomyces sp. JB150]|uniref:ComEA family DNA-binding protein n=1 Tax=Streptomyces sp. JB150 TaxID=2714844 RepID=UPI0019D205D4|nr:ComEA family DNA-binding protein [Streptomyces sp. JB150]
MALRARTRTTSATSGPGRAPASDSRVLVDSRLRHRRPPLRGRSAARQRHAPADELRRRARLLFGEQAVRPAAGRFGETVRAEEGGEGRARGGAEGREEEHAGERRESRAGPSRGGEWEPVEEPGSVGESRPVEEREPVVERELAEAWRHRAGLALRERLPLWLQTRAGLERRNVLALTVLLVVAAGFAVQHFWSGRPETVSAPEVVEAAPAHPEPSGEPVPSAAPTGVPGAGAEIVVDVSGKVREPGIHRLPAGSRVVDALEAAGGVRPGTDTDGLNRARFLVDGEQVVVGGPAPAPAAGSGPGAGSAGGAPVGPVPAGPVSLNTATVEQLDTLPGVGPVLAQHIIDYRTRHGGFRSVDELREVKGIGERRFADLRDLVRP